MLQMHHACFPSWLKEQGILLVHRACFASPLYLKEKVILQAQCFASWLKERDMSGELVSRLGVRYVREIRLRPSVFQHLLPSLSRTDLSRIDSCIAGPSPSGPIESVGQNISLPGSCQHVTSGTTDCSFLVPVAIKPYERTDLGRVYWTCVGGGRWGKGRDGRC